MAERERNGPSLTQRASFVASLARKVPENIPVPNPFERRTLARAVEGKFVLITGASSGIGRALALKVGAAGGEVLLVARTREKLDEVASEIREEGGAAHVHACDLSSREDVVRMADEVLAEHGRVDVLVNNAGRSIRRSVAQSYDRIHDYEKTMDLNFFGAVQLILKVLPGMRERRSGHIINISTMGLQTNTPRFSAYLASKAALDAFSRSIASEIVDDRVAISTVYMPLVRTPMIEPSRHYKYFPALSPDEAAEMVAHAIASRNKKQSTLTGRLSEVTYATVPRVQDAIANAGYRMFPDSKPRSERVEGEGDEQGDGSAEQKAFARATRGTHW
ncbi:MAG TPA: SDR family NAD(P)-dependent oxidoreductase [Solirubrobacterales bacterium]|nr:SDR family NAD(P)-dependent oxidoreductase [Solirubrobacterales bacterium]